MTSKTIAVAQQKGGAGKTTLAAHLSIALAELGLSVAVIDIDPQGSLSNWFALRAENGNNDDELLKLVSAQGWRVENEVRRLQDEFDVVVIDSPPHAETETRLALRVADLVLLPLQPSPMDLWAAEATMNQANSENAEVLYVFNRVPFRSRLADDVAASLQNRKQKMASATLGNRVAFAFEGPYPGSLK